MEGTAVVQALSVIDVPAIKNKQRVIAEGIAQQDSGASGFSV
ncbi:MAG: hypothetical protein AAF437_14940 [Pseudomonadota bacterium]